MRILILEITPGLAGRTIRNLLGAELHMAPSLISRTKLRPGGILLNGQPAHTDVRVRAGDVLAADVSDIAPRAAAAPLDAPLEIVYEDEDLAVLTSPPGWPSTAGMGWGPPWLPRWPAAGGRAPPSIR